jgi:hypothetical protein
MRERIGRVVRCLDYYHHRGIVFLEAPPRHRPRLNQMALDNAVVSGGPVNRMVRLRPIARKKRSIVARNHRKINLVAIHLLRPVQLPHRSAILDGHGVCDQVLIRSL